MTPKRTFRALVGALLSTACVAAPAAPGSGTQAPLAQGEDLVPPGFGSLLQEDVTLTVRSGPLLLKVTPLEESVIRLTAPDTYRRLAELALMHRAAIEERIRAEDTFLFLVSFFSSDAEVALRPEDVLLLNRGRQHSPVLVRGVTGGWESHRLGQQETQMAVYAFGPDLSLSLDLAVEYDGQRSTQWPRILQLLQAERERVRARAGAVP